MSSCPQTQILINVLPFCLQRYLSYTHQLFLTNSDLYRFRDQLYQTNFQTEVFKKIYPQLKSEYQYLPYSEWKQVLIPYLEFDSLKINPQVYPLVRINHYGCRRGQPGKRGFDLSGLLSDGFEVYQPDEGDIWLDRNGVEYNFENGYWQLAKHLCTYCQDIRNRCWCKYQTDHPHLLILGEKGLSPQEYFQLPVITYSCLQFENELKKLNLNIINAPSSGCFGIV